MHRGSSQALGVTFMTCVFLLLCCLIVCCKICIISSVSFAVAMESQPKMELLDRVQVYYLGASLMLVGSLFVISSFLALGFTGTFLGKYCNSSSLSTHASLFSYSSHFSDCLRDNNKADIHVPSFNQTFTYSIGDGDYFLLFCQVFNSCP